jgi:hypothetical protein
MADQQHLNGIDVQQLFDAIAAVKDQPDIATFRFRACNQWVNGGHNCSTINEFYGACREHARHAPFVFEEDEPSVLLGEDHGANSVEFVLTALADFQIRSWGFSSGE